MHNIDARLYCGTDTFTMLGTEEDGYIELWNMKTIKIHSDLFESV